MEHVISPYQTFAKRDVTETFRVDPAAGPESTRWTVLAVVRWFSNNSM